MSTSGFVQGLERFDEQNALRGRLHTRLFKAFRLGTSPSVFFGCVVRLCAVQHMHLCHQVILKSAPQEFLHVDCSHVANGVSNRFLNNALIKKAM